MNPALIANIIFLIIGMALLVKGADYFVDGASNIARALKIPSLIIGLTLVSMGTSAPEASVSINSAINGFNDISIGNVVGSNIVNTLLILGLSALIIPMFIDRDMKKFDVPIMIAFYVVIILFSFVITPFTIDRLEGIALLIFFVGYIVFLVLRAKKSVPSLKDAEETQNKKRQPIWLSLIFTAFGLTCIILGGELVVDNASGLAKALGMSETLVALTIVAVGTSLPELVTSVVAAVKKEADIAVGNVIGSNIFNIVFILGMSSVISPLTVASSSLFDMIVMLISSVIVMLIALFSKKVNRAQGGIMLLMYIAFLMHIIIRN